MSAIKMFGYEDAQAQKFETERWATKEQIHELSSGDEQRDIILGHDASLAYFEDDKTWEKGVNSNVMVIGGSSAGKSDSFIKTNALNHRDVNSVIVDTKGELHRALSEGYESDGYDVAVLDTIDVENSIGYDPLRYIETEEDIPTIAEMLLDALAPNRHRTLDGFWEQSSALLLRAVVGLLFSYERLDGTFAPGADPAQERKYLRMNRVFELLKLIKISEDDRLPCPLDYLVDALAAGDIPLEGATPLNDAYGVGQYRNFRCAADRTLKSILITLNARVSILQTPQMKRVFDRDEIRLDRLDEGRRVLFIKMSDNDSTNSWLARIAIKQAFNMAQRKADANPNGRLARNVEFVLDEFPNVGRIPDFERSVATVRSRGINFLMCIQSLGQLDSVYGVDVARVILDNCDSVVYMGGGSSIETQRFICDLCGESVLGTDHVGTEHTAVKVRGSVITPGEVGLLPRTDCIVKVSGRRPFRTKKYFCADHPNAHKWLRR